MHGMHLSSRLRRKVPLLLVATLVISALAAGPALAKGRFTLYRTGNERCWVIPNPVSNDVAGQTYTVWGSGFWPGLTVNIFVVDSLGGTTILSTGASGDGGALVPRSDGAEYLPDGTANVYVYQMGDRRMTVLASCSFVVS